MWRIFHSNCFVWGCQGEKLKVWLAICLLIVFLSLFFFTISSSLFSNSYLFNETSTLMLVIPCCSSKRRFFKMLACCSDFKRRKFALLRPFLTLYISNFDFPKYLVVYFEIFSSISNHSSTICALKSKTKTTKTGRRLLNVYLPAHTPSKLLSFIFFPRPF